MVYTLTYSYVRDVVERRDPFRADHLALVREYHDAGKLLLAGAFDPPAEGALLVFRADSAADVEGFVARDPYVKGGIVTSHRILPWNLVIGG